MRRRRYQKGSLQKRKQGRSMVWSALWWQDGTRRYRTLGRCSEMSQGRARYALDGILQPLNRAAEERHEKPTYTFGEFVTLKYLPFCQRKWKDSTAMTTNQRIKHNLVEELGSFQIDSIKRIKREQLRDFLEKKVYRRAVL